MVTAVALKPCADVFPEGSRGTSGRSEPTVQRERGNSDTTESGNEARDGLAGLPSSQVEAPRLARAWDAAHPRDSPLSPLNCPPVRARLCAY